MLDKALAAIGDGPVIHVITRGDWGASLVDLSTGRVRPVYGESEVWYDAQRGVHYISRLGDEIAFEDVLPPDARLDQPGAQYIALANHYRDELRSGKARVVASGRVGDRKVLWIRVRAQWLPDSADGKNHLFAEEVAVERATYEPVYLRSTRDGRAPPGSGLLIVTLETPDSGRGDFTVEKPAARPGFGGFGLRRNLDRAAIQRVFGGRAVWLGRSFDGKPLVEAKEAEFRARQSADDEWDVSKGISLFYGSLLPRRGGVRFRDNRKPFVQVLETTERSPGWIAFHFGIENVPDGSVLMRSTRSGFLVRDGVYISVSAKTSVDVLKAATGLRRVGAPAPSSTGLDFDRIASQLGPHPVVETTGMAPVEPRLLVRCRGKRLHTKVANGVKVETFAAGLARFDARHGRRRTCRVASESHGELLRRVRWARAVGCVRRNPAERGAGDRRDRLPHAAAAHRTARAALRRLPDRRRVRTELAAAVRLALADRVSADRARTALLRGSRRGARAGPLRPERHPASRSEGDEARCGTASSRQAARSQAPVHRGQFDSERVPRGDALLDRPPILHRDRPRKNRAHERESVGVRPLTRINRHARTR